MNASERERLALLIESLQERAKHPVLTTVELIEVIDYLRALKYLAPSMRSQEWVKKFEALMEKHENALMRYMEIPEHQLLIRDRTFEVLVATRSALIDFARSDWEATDDRPE